MHAFLSASMNRMTIGTLATTTGVKVTTIRYYERAELMPRPGPAGRQRIYTEDHLRRLRFICRARELKFSIEDVRVLLILAEPARTSCRDIHDLAATHLQKLRREITALEKLATALSSAVAQCSGKPNPTCPLLEMLRSGD
jgi:MerR family transcriptional regulator, mercuric resistance operon regulatory protein